MNQVIVIVPIYRSTMKDTENVSFRSILTKLGAHPIVLVNPVGMDLSLYIQIASEQGVSLHSEEFDSHYFIGIAGYNRLMLSQGFYQRFSNYNYMLIAQLDTYIFRDELLDWCKKGYDYIGAPWVGAYNSTSFDVNKLSVGNGGLSLRKTESFLRFFNGRKNVIPCERIANNIGLKKKPYTRWLVWLLMALGWHNKPKWFEKNYRWNEDGFWCLTLQNSNYALRLPEGQEAMQFAFERFPKDLYAITKKLPFGCHAWEKYNYEDFWRQWIKK